MVDSDDIGPIDLEIALLYDRLDFGLRRRRCWWRAVLGFMRQECERHAEDIDVLRIEQVFLLVKFVRDPSEPAADDLLAKQLAGESAQAHDVRDRPRDRKSVV